MLQFIDSAQFMVSSLSNLVKNLSEGTHIIKCIYGQNDKKNVKLSELNISTLTIFLNTQTLKMI